MGNNLLLLRMNQSHLLLLIALKNILVIDTSLKNKQVLVLLSELVLLNLKKLNNYLSSVIFMVLENSPVLTV